MAIHDAFYTDQFRPVLGFHRNEDAQSQVEFLEKAIPLEAGCRVWDLGCGFGRHSIVLARKGYQVTGYDASADFIAQARRTAAEAALAVDFKLFDQRRLEAREEFDAVLSLTTSLTFYDDVTSKDIMRRIHGALRPGGAFVYDQGNIFWLIESLVNRPKPPPAQLSDGRRHTTSVSFDPVKCVLSRRSALEGPQGHVDAGWDMRFYVLPELVELLTGLGFRVERVYGGCDGSAYGLASQRMVAISRKT